jgi:hypothetical protein
MDGDINKSNRKPGRFHPIHQIFNSQSARALTFAILPRNNHQLDAAISHWQPRLANMHLFGYSFRAPFSFCE